MEISFGVWWITSVVSNFDYQILCQNSKMQNLHTLNISVLLLCTLTGNKYTDVFFRKTHTLKLVGGWLQPHDPCHHICFFAFCPRMFYMVWTWALKFILRKSMQRSRINASTPNCLIPIYRLVCFY